MVKMTFFGFSLRRFILYGFKGFWMGCFWCFLSFFMEGSQCGSRRYA